MISRTNETKDNNENTISAYVISMYFLTLYILYCFPLHTARHALLGYYPGENVTAAILQKFTSNKSADKSCVRTKLHNGMVLTLDNDIYLKVHHISHSSGGTIVVGVGAVAPLTGGGHID